MKHILSTLSIIFCSIIPYGTSNAQTAFKTESGIKWYNPALDSIPVIEGIAWPGEASNPYYRLPDRAEDKVSSHVWHLSRHSAGAMIRFTTNADNINIRYTVGGNFAMDHMPATGVSGVDLYAIDADGKWIWGQGNYRFGDTVTYTFTGINPNAVYHNTGREYRLYLPLYNSVKWLEIGIPENANFISRPVRDDLPIIIYGTSIVHGGCASRPGMAWPAILGRNMDRPVINLGFSGNGVLEEGIIDLISEYKAKVYILDCLPNLVDSNRFSEDEVKKRIINSVNKIQAKHKDTPIILVEHAGYTDAMLQPARMAIYKTINRIQKEVYTDLKTSGTQNLYLLTEEEIGLSIDGTVDGTHPNDLGMYQQALAVEKLLRKVLHEPKGTLSTTIPCTQYREPQNYDWENRHRAVLEFNRRQKPDVVFIGNSITHFWGGKPEHRFQTGPESWNSIINTYNPVNMGFGYDRVENVLWRIYHGELDNFNAKQIYLMIGTNNIHINPDKDIIEGIDLVLQAIIVRQPQIQIYLTGIYPRRNTEEHITNFNTNLTLLAEKYNINFIDPGRVLTGKEGKIDESLFSDGLHPNNAGYNRLVQEYKKYLEKSRK